MEPCSQYACLSIDQALVVASLSLRFPHCQLFPFSQPVFNPQQPQHVCDLISVFFTYWDLCLVCSLFSQCYCLKSELEPAVMRCSSLFFKDQNPVWYDLCLRRVAVHIVSIEMLPVMGSELIISHHQTWFPTPNCTYSQHGDLEKVSQILSLG